jgi:hypothetical protein
VDQNVILGKQNCRKLVCFLDTVFNNTLFLPFTITKHSSVKAHFTVRNKQHQFPSYTKIVSKENFISDDKSSFPAHTTVMHSSCNTVQCYTKHKLSYKKQVQVVHVNTTPYMSMHRFWRKFSNSGSACHSHNSNDSTTM